MSQVTAQPAAEVVELASVQPAPLPWAGQPRRAWGQLALATDASMLALAVLSAEVWAHVAATRTAWGWAAVLLCITLLALNRKRLHRSPLHLRVIDTLVAVVLATAFATSTTITLLVLAGDSDDLAAQTVRLAFLAAAFVGAGRITLTLRERRTRRSGSSGSRALIVGAGHVGQRLAKRLIDYPEFGLRPIGFLDKEPLEPTENGITLPVLGASWDFERVVRSSRSSTLSSPSRPRRTDVCSGSSALPGARRRGHRSSRGSTRRSSARIERRACLGGSPAGHASRAGDPTGWQFAIKYALDRILAGRRDAARPRSLIFGVLALAVR